MSKFIQTSDHAGDPVIINLEVITHIFKVACNNTLNIHLGRYVVTLQGENADIFWDLLSKQSLHLYQQPQEDEKEGND
ncbi:MAG: hypothetical protein KME54_26760 [Tolypothrix brevis GSE-NOS-MK-07-07A]|nr:hypothetical protein [Tolypothrix brevis GSE-NOS-MK-07-07A]